MAKTELRNLRSDDSNADRKKQICNVPPPLTPTFSVAILLQLSLLFLWTFDFINWEGCPDA